MNWTSGFCLDEAHGVTPESAAEYHARCAGAFWNPATRQAIVCTCPNHQDENRCRVCRRAHADLTDYDQYNHTCVDTDACLARVQARAAANPIIQMIKECRGENETDTGIPPPPRARGGKSPRDCECACGGKTRGGRFIPGHDAKLKSVLLKKSAGGDTAATDELRRRGWERKK